MTNKYPTTIYWLPVAIIRVAVGMALPRADADKVARWAALFTGWTAPTTIHGGRIITADSTRLASNIARRAWKNSDGTKGTHAVALTRWTMGDLLVKASSATPTVDSLRIATTQAVDKIQTALPDAAAMVYAKNNRNAPTIESDPMVAVSLDSIDQTRGVIVTAYMMER